ncbi:MAG TPA: hypothetical protein VIY52_34495 [Streptosporangiaceae bacterium]
MSVLGMFITRGAAIVPLTLLALALGFVVIVAVIHPTPARQAIVGTLGRTIKDLGGVIAGGHDQRLTQRPVRKTIAPKK